MNGIIGIADTLRSGAAGKISPELDRHLWMIVVSGRRLANLVDDIMDFSKLKHNDLDIRPVPVDLFTLTEVVLTICEPLTNNKSVQLQNEIDPSTPIVMADENRLQQILYNLVGNAIKHTDKGHVTVTAKKNNNLIEIAVIDTGKGISSHELENIFEPFYQADSSLSREADGSGIGLSLTKRLVELHQGQLTVSSTLGHGSTFTFTLPISEEQTSNAELDTDSSLITRLSIEDNVDVAPVAATSTHQGAATILIADDEAVNLQVLKNQLLLNGYNVIAVSNGEAVLEVVQEQTVDLLILDIMMPKLSGYDVCQHLRKHYSLVELPILMLTAKNMMNDQLTAFEVGANDYLAKPCDRQELLSRVETLLKLSHLNQDLKTLNSQLEAKVDARTQELRNANQGLLDMAKTRRMLLANIAHELGTPVTVIKGYMQAVQEGLMEEGDPRYLNMVDHKLKMLSRLIGDLSELSELEAGTLPLHREAINLNDWLEDIHIKHESYVTQENRIFSFKKVGNTALYKTYTCHIDIGRMDQMTSNLVWNAVKHTEPTEGTITMTVSLKEKTSEVILQLEDNGHGIHEEELPFIFERFYKAAHKSEEDIPDGSGLGLAIAKEIVQAHDGTIWAESQLGRGTTFFIALPIYTA
ncbi:Histidine protein kinase DivJ [Lentibacillus sp. JNUCC-1]|uniref:ATP-binding protein n=1 Tax=Lentibacillus sp. JNUCC-1 TaxID=2654513 RepID=UPI0012E71C00|nr:ATP-binding protein [Lentibacillus sp. JNUCC-1]MUV38179.1 Histidine protein kinase DivJ [Lentibacillus sp. JNUCC-1]